MPQDELFSNIGSSFEFEVEEDEDVPPTPEKEEEPAKKETPEGKEEKPEKEEESKDIIDKVVFDEGEEEDEPESDKKETTEDEKDVKEALDSDDEDFDYESTVQKLIDSGYWEDFEERDDIEITKDVFKQIAKEQAKLKTEKYKQEAFSTLTEDEKEYLEFKKNGGNLDDYYRSKTLVNNVNNIDITTEQGKAQAIIGYYRHIVGWDDAKIEKHLSRVVEDMELDSEAEMADSKLKEHFSAQHQQMVERQQKLVEQREEKIKEYKKSIRSVLKDKGVADKDSSSFVKALTEIDDTGTAKVDKAYMAFRNDPEKAVLLWEFLSDPEKFMEKAGEKEAKKEAKKAFITLKANKKSESTDIQQGTKQRKNRTHRSPWD